MRRIEDEEVRRLLAAARPMRRMTEAERARTARFVAALAREPARRREAGQVFRGASMAAAAVVILFFCPGYVVDEAEGAAVVSIEAEPPRVMENGFAWYAERRESIEGIGNAQPGYGDVCGARVCDFEPSCCEEGWNEHCDRKLIELSRTVFAMTMDVGRCAWHDRESCPKCACPMYLKRIESRDENILLGYDGGTGCLRDPARLLVELKWMCTQGFCEE